MRTRKIRDLVTGTCEIAFIKKKELHVWVCQSCGIGFVAQRNSIPDIGKLRGIFSEHFPETGNMFSAECCSYACADALVKGGWKKIEEYARFRDADAHIVWTQYAHGAMKYENEVGSEWDHKKERRAPEGPIGGDGHYATAISIGNPDDY